MAGDDARSEMPSVWLFTALAIGSSLTPLINRALGDPISAKMNTMLAIAGIAFPAASLLYLLGKPKRREKAAVLLAFLGGAATLRWVDWSQFEGRVFVIVAVLFLIPTLVRLLARG